MTMTQIERGGRQMNRAIASRMPHWLRLCIVALATVLGYASPGTAQVAYNLFPAAQPTRHGMQSLVTLVVRDSSVLYAVNELSRQAHLRPIYNDGPLLAKRHVTVRLVNVRAAEAFASVLAGTGLSATMAGDGETVVIGIPPGHPVVRFTQPAGGAIRGRVVDSATGAGLGGATIRILGTTLSTISSDSGHFLLKGVLAGEQVLSVKLFGYRPSERTVTVIDSEQTRVTIALAPVPTVLSGVLTTATGVQRKIEVGNDITSLNVDSIMRVAPISSVTDLLETRVPGLTVMHSSGTPGDPSRLRLRGASSVTEGNDPIVIVDGIRVYASQSDTRNNNLAPSAVGGSSLAGNGVSVGPGPAYAAPSPLDQIDPNSIETIEVFKGPSAAALYGSDAANGVIVVTTKRGRAGPTHWEFTVGGGVNWLPGSWPTNYYKFGYDRFNFLTICAWYDVPCAVDSVVAFQALNDPRYTVLSHGNDQTAALTVSGGVPTLQYSLSGSGSRDLGNLKLPAIEQQRYDSAYGPIPTWMVRPDNYQTWSLGGVLTAVPNTRLHVTLQSTLFSGDQQRSSLESALSQLAGEYVTSATDICEAFNTNFCDAVQRPLIQNDVERATDNQLTSTNALSLQWQPRPWLPLSITGGINTIQRVDQTYIPFGVCNTGPGSPQCGSDTTGSYGLGRGTTRDQTLTVGTTIPLLNQHVMASVGGNLYTESIADFSAYTNQLAPGVTTPTTFPCPANSPNCQNVTQSSSGTSTYGWYVEPRLNLSSRFFAAPGFRLDGGNGGATSAGSIGGLSAFPKIDFSYVAVDRQNERPLWGVFTQVRPRLSFGFAGTQPSPADKLRLFNVGDYKLPQAGQVGLTNNDGNCQPTLSLDGVNYVPVVCLDALGNTQLRPERSSQFEGGVDVSLWRNRLQLTYTQYDKTRHDAILSIPVAPSLSSFDGAPFNIDKNIGVIRNTGTEVTMTANLLESRAVSWTVAANLSNDNSLVVRLNPGQPPLCFGLGTPCTGTRVVAGYPLFGVWERPIIGFTDANHNGIIDANEVRYADSTVYVGQPNPKYQMNFTSNLALFNGRLSINATFAYQNGLTQDNQGACNSGAFNQLPNAPNASLATEAAVVAANCIGNGSLTGAGVTNIGLLQTVNTFRFQALSVNYEVPHRVSVWMNLPRMSVALQGSNLGLSTNYRGKDPAVNAFSTVSAGDETEDLGQLPEPRTWWLKVTMGN